ncbi:MAG TPA: amino acid adenylation domain-containing protein [Thermoanaerobaculia bacterium]
MTLDDILIAYRDGKITRDELRTQLRQIQPQAPAADPPVPSSGDLHSATVQHLTALFAGTLGIPASAIVPTATFDQFGMDSILGMQITKALEQGVGALPASLLFECQTVDQLAAWLTSHCAGRLPALVQRAEREPARPVPPRIPSTPFPLSEGQKGLWVEWRKSPESSSYNLALGLLIRDMLDVDTFRQAFEHLLSRQPVLTGVIEDDGGIPMQRHTTLEQPPFSHEYWLGRGLDEAVTHLNEIARTPFALDEGPLVRLRLLTLSPAEHVMLLAVHHIVCDGASWPVIVSTLLGAYDDIQNGRTPAPAPLPTPYRDFAEWEEAFLASPEAEAHRAYWRQQLAGPLPVLALPADRRGASGPMAADTVAQPLGAELSARVRAQCRAQHASAATYLLAVYKLLLHRYGGADDVIVGVPTMGRSDARFRETVGYFVNMVAIRSAVDGRQPFRDFLRGVRDTVAAGVAHAAYPFPAVVRDLDVQREHAPVFQVGYSYESAALFGGRAARERYARGLSIEVLESINRAGAFGEYELALEAREVGDEIELAFKYDSRRFERATVERWMSHYLHLLDAVLRDPEVPVADPALLSEEEARQLDAWNDTAADYPDRLLVHQLVEEQAAATPSAVAVLGGGQSITYDELNRRANQVAAYLRARGIGRDGVVAVCVDRTIEMVVGILGVLKAGAAYLPVDPRYPRDRRAYMLESAALVLTDAALREDLPETGRAEAAPYIVTLDGDWPEIARHDAANVHDANATPADLAYVIFTSGSTGQPKGTAMPHRALVNLIEWHRRTWPAKHAPRTLQFAALGFDVAFQEIFTTLATGGTLVLIAEAVRSDPSALVAVLREHAIQRLFLPFSALQGFAEAATRTGAALTALEDVITAGERLRITPEIAGFFASHRGARLHNHYGPTESHVVTAAVLSGDPDGWEEFPPIGRPIANARIHVLDERRRPVPIGTLGEIYIGGVAVARGYLNRPELTAERFVADPFSTDPQARLYRTGDLARLRSDGEIEYAGRNDDQVKIRGFRVELGEIESQLRRHPAVKEAVVVAREEPGGSKRLIAYITRSADDSPEELRAALKAALPDYMVPSAFVTLETLPLTPNGKVDRRNLPAPELSAFAVRKYEAPEGELESSLAAVWQALLGVGRIGRHDNFFDLGGHSLLAMQVLARLREDLGIELSPAMLFDHPTVAALAEFMGARMRARDLSSKRAAGAQNTRQRGVL